MWGERIKIFLVGVQMFNSCNLSLFKFSSFFLILLLPLIFSLSSLLFSFSFFYYLFGCLFLFSPLLSLSSLISFYSLFCSLLFFPFITSLMLNELKKKVDRNKKLEGFFISLLICLGLY